jgi:prepilin signal peptidase PulO-like enzyme (type II secretory pathway)
MMPLLWVVAVFLLITGIIDWKIRKIPSIFLTGMLFVVAFISISLNPNALSLGVLGFIMAYLLYEADFFGGVADVKVMTIISFMCLNTYWLLASFVLIGLFGITWKAILKIRTGEKECAFLPIFFFVYVTLYMLGGLFL